VVVLGQQPGKTQEFVIDDGARIEKGFRETANFCVVQSCLAPRPKKKYVPRVPRRRQRGHNRSMGAARFGGGWAVGVLGWSISLGEDRCSQTQVFVCWAVHVGLGGRQERVEGEMESKQQRGRGAAWDVRLEIGIQKLSSFVVYRDPSLGVGQIKSPLRPSEVIRARP
jgi:hypothetical protein